MTTPITHKGATDATFAYSTAFMDQATADIITRQMIKNPIKTPSALDADTVPSNAQQVGQTHIRGSDGQS